MTSDPHIRYDHVWREKRDTIVSIRGQIVVLAAVFGLLMLF
jgi:hypothetical protein